MIRLRLICSLCFLILLIFSPAVSVTAQSSETKVPAGSWVGEYLFEIAESRTAAGSLPTIEYRLIVTKKGELLSGRLVADGYQTDDRYICSLKPDGDDKIGIFYLKDDTIPGEPARHSYKRGELLGSLNRIFTNGKTKYLFIEGSYEIYPPAFAVKHPIYFRKTK